MTYSEPLLSLILLVGLIGVLRLPNVRGKKWAIGAVLGLVLVAWPPFDWLFSRPLEGWYAVRPTPEGEADAIVVLSASVDPPHGERPYPLVGRDTYARCRFAAWLYRKWKPLPVLACGGGAGHGAPAFAVSMREVLESAGVPESDIWTEERSRSTYENARYGAEILRSHGIRKIALVVDAQSMMRAAASFRKQGITVAPAPSEFRQWGGLREEMWLNWKAIQRNETTLHEVLGLVWYKLHGWI